MNKPFNFDAIGRELLPGEKKAAQDFVRKYKQPLQQKLNILDKLEFSLVQYLETHPYPVYLYMGEQECVALDKHFGGIQLEKFGCQIVQVMNRSWLKWGD